VNIIEKNSYILRKIENNTHHIFNLIKRKIPSSIFSSLNYEFFNNIVKKRIIHLYIIQYKKKNAAIVSVATVANLKKLKYKMLLFYLINPLNFLVNIINIFGSLSRTSKLNFNKSYLYLLHLIIYKKNFTNFSIKKKDQIFNFFFKNILRVFRAKSLFLCYEKKNVKANRFYLRNNFIVYGSNKNLIFAKKKII
jgi:hypothetical protein